MKKIYLSLPLAMGLFSSLQADSLSDAFANAKVSGQIRTFYIDRDLSNSTTPDNSAIATGGHLKIETAPIEGLSAGTAFYTTQGMGLNNDDLTKVNGTLFDDDKNSYSILGEAYLKYSKDKTSVTIGRQKLDTPLAGSDDARMLPNLFEGIVASNSDIKDTTIIAGHITKMAAGTFSNAYGDANGAVNAAGALALHSGYGLNNKSARFMDMGEYAVGADTKGVSALAFINTSVPNLKLQAWDYYAHDILNALYLQADYKIPSSSALKPSLSAQYIKESDIGDKIAGEVDSNYYCVKAGVAYNNLTADVAYSSTGSSAGTTTNGGIISPWGGSPSFTQGMVTRHSFFANTDAYKLSAGYNLKDDLGLNLTPSAYFASYDIGKENAYSNGNEWTAKEKGFDIKYNPASIKNLELKLRGNFTDKFHSNGTQWDEYRVIANYNF